LKSLFIINRTLSIAIALIAITLAGTESVLPAEEADASHDDPDSAELSLKSLDGLYSERIAKLTAEVRNESEQRTLIIDQLDTVMNELARIESQSLHESKNSPSLIHSLEQINTEIEALEHDISADNQLLTQLQNTLDSQPELSIWQAALGKPEVRARQKLLATQSYLIHTARKHQDQLKTKKALLDKRYQSIMKYNQGVKDSITELRTHFEKMLERRQDLEYQLTEFTDRISVRQERISRLTEKSQLMVSSPDKAGFRALARKLLDPVEGQLIRRFSEPKAKGLLKWKGILVQAPLGLPFTAVSDGLVVFADQLQGLGNVAIIDHGQGYMTLYGMAELLLVEKDQFLLAGDPVGTIGESVGEDASALYFEVRHNADALDPQNWLKMNRISKKKTL